MAGGVTRRRHLIKVCLYLLPIDRYIPCTTLSASHACFPPPRWLPSTCPVEGREGRGGKRREGKGRKH
ncbi:hypothetical protein E2C01_091576 [Portunus trituberculatus]|uniref:Uncharacterized protein n=1 Tax=Portunus trituberculatus TaxID=210409 RepID=A0A5B7JVE5_PORTR|nr:hypothetical protein [Portunus trituberculatus]